MNPIPPPPARTALGLDEPETVESARKDAAMYEDDAAHAIDPDGEAVPTVAELLVAVVRAQLATAARIGQVAAVLGDLVAVSGGVGDDPVGTILRAMGGDLDGDRAGPVQLDAVAALTGLPVGTVLAPVGGLLPRSAVKVTSEEDSGGYCWMVTGKADPITAPMVLDLFGGLTQVLGG